MTDTILLRSPAECYHIITILGRGAFGKVSKSWKKSNGDYVAIKILKNDPIGRIILHDYQADNVFFLLPIKHIRTITSQLLEALVKLKELPVVYADLKPENIMLVNQENNYFKVKIIDFGNATFLNELNNKKEPYIQSRWYREPEVLLGLPCSDKIDMWSFGCFIVELFLGKPLYPADHEYNMTRYICDTHGQSSSYLLNVAKKFEMETNSKEKRMYILTSLDELETLYFKTDSILDDTSDIKNMIDLVKKMLTWDANERIAPEVALSHPFISNNQHKDDKPVELETSLSTEESQYPYGYPVVPPQSPKNCPPGG
ncbi:hypothetical protein GDO86_006852 [Hymenochirus boettgeri]|uniref:Protein kinase domain-containing protein n=1 Tax=Hymenochirus boettgeri TaxID=247094 RepID=A0A8T2JCP8_9PIPI|nr:hypothetical protein GDO86_006852 [Hymenochirus boettgeri]